MSDFDALDALAADTSSTEAEAGTAHEGQGQPDATPSAVQPEGQGQQDASTGLYDLSSVPEEYRSHVERIAKDIDRNVNAKLQEAADYRKSWEPYQELGLHEYDPQGLSGLMQFAEALSDPQTARDALFNLAGALEIDLADGAGDPGELDPIHRLEQQQAEMQAFLAAWQEEQALNAAKEEALQGYRSEFADVEKAHGKQFDDAEKQRLIGLAKRFAASGEERPIEAAYAFINDIAGGAEKALVEAQPTPPAPAEPGGRASTAIQPVDSFEEAERLHRERNASVHA